MQKKILCNLCTLCNLKLQISISFHFSQQLNKARIIELVSHDYNMYFIFSNYEIIIKKNCKDICAEINSLLMYFYHYKASGKYLFNLNMIY